MSLAVSNAPYLSNLEILFLLVYFLQNNNKMQHDSTYVFDVRNDQLKLIQNLYTIFLLYFNNFFLISTVSYIYTFDILFRYADIKGIIHVLKYPAG